MRRYHRSNTGVFRARNRVENPTPYTLNPNPKESCRKGVIGLWDSSSLRFAAPSSDSAEDSGSSDVELNRIGLGFRV